MPAKATVMTPASTMIAATQRWPPTWPTSPAQKEKDDVVANSEELICAPTKHSVHARAHSQMSCRCTKKQKTQLESVVASLEQHTQSEKSLEAQTLAFAEHKRSPDIRAGNGYAPQCPR